MTATPTAAGRPDAAGPAGTAWLPWVALCVQRLPTSTVATYAYVNPVVAVFLGAVVLDEVVSGRILLRAAVVVASVALTLSARRRAPAPAG